MQNPSFPEEDHAASGEMTASGDEANEDEFSVPATVASPRFHDRAQQDGSGYYGLTGFLGKASSICWMEEVLAKLTAASFDSDGRDFPFSQIEI